MYAIILDGSRQLKVQEGEEIEIDYRKASAGSQVSFDRVLAVGADSGLKFGSPMIEKRWSRPKCWAWAKAPSWSSRSFGGARTCAARPGIAKW